ncbi:MAG: dimethylmenaquinone methyltransferase [Oceanospirillales bacterium LUC14_002_19_P2]|nr:MAG: dimethylmenaquinone methyltransferase [Oceanospirillales bacterium LUC14_002_19_P2]
MNKEYEVFCQRLKTRQDELERRVANITRDVTRKASADWSEQAQERENDEVLDALGNEAVAELRLIQKALERIEEGDYGLCTGCGGDIPVARLEIMPYTDLCVKCAENQE